MKRELAYREEMVQQLQIVSLYSTKNVMNYHFVLVLFKYTPQAFPLQAMQMQYH